MVIAFFSAYSMRFVNLERPISVIVGGFGPDERWTTAVGAPNATQQSTASVITVGILAFYLVKPHIVNGVEGSV